MNIQFNDLTLLYSFDMLKRDNLVWSRKHGLGKVVRLYGKDSGWEARGHGREASSTRGRFSFTLGFSKNRVK